MESMGDMYIKLPGNFIDKKARAVEMDFTLIPQTASLLPIGD